MIRALVFDFGNVVGFFSHRRTTERLLPHVDLPFEELHRRLFAAELEDAFEAGRLSAAELLRRVRASCGFRCSDDEVRAAYADIFWPNPAVCDLVPRLAGRYRLFLLSNTNEIHAAHYRRQFAPTFEHFDALVLSHEVGLRKPASEIYRHCERLAGCAPAECLFLDDLPANVAGAEACGWRGIVYRPCDDLLARLAAFGVHVGNGL